MGTELRTNGADRSRQLLIREELSRISMKKGFIDPEIAETEKCTDTDKNDIYDACDRFIEGDIKNSEKGEHDGKLDYRQEHQHDPAYYQPVNIL